MLATLQQDISANGKAGSIIMVPRRRIRPFPDQPRKFFDLQKLQELASSIKTVGQIVPAFVKEVDDHHDYDYELVDGQRRWHACDMAQVIEMKVIVVEVENQAQQFLISVVSNFGRVDHTPLETAQAIKYFKDQGMAAKQISDIFARSQGWVYQHLKILQLDNEVLAMMSPEVPEQQRLGLSSALLIADVPADMQKKIAAQVVSDGMKVNQARNFIRQRAEKAGFSVGSPERTPRSDYRVFRSFVGRLKRELEMFMGMPHSFYENMFQHREDEDHAQVVERMEKNIEELQALLKTLKRVKETA